jgi:hypothetical protein
MVMWPPKDPDEILDYQIDWSDRLFSDAIVSSVWTVPPGLVGGAQSIAGASTVLWLSGGSLGQTYKIHNRVVTSGGRTLDQTVGLQIRTK